MEEAAWREAGKQCTLLLDVRDVPHFDDGRIAGAVHFDKGRIHRAEPFNSFMYGFKNDERRRVVVYDDTGENDSLKIASELVLRGFKHVFVLVGGFRGFGVSHGELIKGKMPPAPPPQAEEDLISLYTMSSSQSRARKGVTASGRRR